MQSDAWLVAVCDEWSEFWVLNLFFAWQRLAGSSLLILANKQDIQGALTPEEIGKVRDFKLHDHWVVSLCLDRVSFYVSVRFGKMCLLYRLE